MKKQMILPAAIMLIMSWLLAIPASYAAETGRYQLFQGEYKFVNIKGEEVWSKALLKIDTVTGEVWIGDQWQLMDQNGKTKQKRAWRPFVEEIDISKPVGNK